MGSLSEKIVVSVVNMWAKVNWFTIIAMAALRRPVKELALPVVISRWGLFLVVVKHVILDMVTLIAYMVRLLNIGSAFITIMV